MKYDFLIVGQGISGTVLGLLLKQYNKSFLIIDKNDLITSSKVAAEDKREMFAGSKQN